MISLRNLTDAESGALFRKTNGRLYAGIGPFREVATAPKDAPAFYINTYDLNDPKPWKIPSEFEEIPTPDPLPAAPPIAWEYPSLPLFEKVFSEIKDELINGKLRKTVPALSVRGILPPTANPQLLIARACIQMPDMHSYAYWNSSCGFAGLSPETLFSLRGNNSETMALAGTASADDEYRLVHDPKELAEHQIVVNAIRNRLSPYGKITLGERRTRKLNGLVHLYTPISLKSATEHSAEFWLRLLHPTPALGPHPRTEQTLQNLMQWRHRLNCPQIFGAPFGLSLCGETEMIAVLRGISWEDGQVFLTAGCGIIADSSLENEWNELKLKRKSIAEALQIPIGE